MRALGDFIGGRFLPPEGQPLRSTCPADGRVVLETAWDPARIAHACEAAHDALAAWRATPFDARVEALGRFREALRERGEGLAEAVTAETGKLRAEARAEVAGLVGRFDAVAARIREDMRDGPLPGHPHEIVRHHPLGVVGVIGPFNFPLHLCHAHVVPALMLGNTVVVKPSEVAPLAAQRYAEAALAAGLPPGVLNVVAGLGPAGAALVSNPRLRGLAFTGSWATGRRILEATLDRPEVLVALEMGGKNTAVVLDDADLRQAAHELVVGGYLTTGQRCTCTDRVLVSEPLRGRLIDALARVVSELTMGHPDDPASFAGPLATLAQKERFLAAVATGEAGGAERVARGRAPDGAAFVAPTLHVLPPGLHHIAGYTDTEIFGPDLHVESVRDDDEAIAILNGSEAGLANAVFTADRARFERFYRETTSGLVNWNRSTNQASPRLPFGGTGKSGNYRPAGAWAPRNLAVPVAIQENLPGELCPSSRIAELLPPPDLDALEARHEAEEAAEAERTLVDEPRPMRLVRPKGGRLPASEGWLERLYAGDRVVREKKPGVFDHLRSVGPWFVSVDDEPLSVLDGMTQTATLCAGFAEAPVVRAYVEGGFGDTLLHADAGARPAEEYAARLRQLVPGLPFVSFVNSGAEACEKALALCKQRARSDEQRKVLAFEGSFHGRTLLALHASYNPSKRAPFEIAGHEVTFAPFPTWWEPHAPEPPAPESYYATVARGRMDDAQDRWGASVEGLLASEVRALAEVHEALAGGEHFAVIVEPMQSEGGDRYATARFFRALRLLTRHHGVPLVFDEVQTGFGLGGTVAWHTRFQLIARDGNPDGPDCVTFAKRAQAGVVMSRFEDPEPTSAHAAALVRGRIHAEMMADDRRAARVEARVRRRLARLARRFPDLVSHPRATGYALAFDLPTAAHLAAFLGQRFWRGAIVFGAGSRTVRYRLNTSFGKPEIDQLFDAIRRSLSWLDAHPGKTPPAWEDLPEPALETREIAEERPRPEIRYRQVSRDDAARVLEQILLLEERVYEPARRDPPEKLRMAFDDPDGVAVVCEVREPDRGAGEWALVGCALGAPLEKVGRVEGPDRDSMLGEDNTLYALALTVDPGYRGLGIGRVLKHELTRAARERRRPDGTPRYLHIAGRNRVGKTDAMMRVNESLGAYELVRLRGVYGDPEAQAVYYRMPAGPFVVDPSLSRSEAEEGPIDLASGLSRPFLDAPESLRRALDRGLLFGPAVNKITLCNYVTPAIVRAIEHVAALRPELPHLYLASSRDETFDKTVRMLRWHRKEAQVVLGLAGGYVGHTSAAARSLSDPAVHRQGPGYFGGFCRVPHPEDAGADATIGALDAAVREAGGPGAVIGLFVEPMQERTGRVVPEAFWARLAEWRERTGVPVVLVETATASYRSGMGPFAHAPMPRGPDAVTWWGGGQIGFVHASDEWFVPSPLTLVSTWDGDELSLVRVHHQLRAARRLSLVSALDALDVALAPARDGGFEVRGTGLHRVIAAPGRAEWLSKELLDRGIRVRAYSADHVGVVPPLDVPTAHLGLLGGALREVLP